MCDKVDSNKVLIKYIKENNSISFSDIMQYEEKNNCWFGPYFDLYSFIKCNMDLGRIAVDSINGTITFNNSHRLNTE